MILSTLCYIKQNGKTLMLHRVKKHYDIHDGKWNGLGGKFISGETPEECVIREVFEESGLKITNPRLRGVLTFPDFSCVNPVPFPKVPGSKLGETESGTFGSGTGMESWYVFVYTATEFTGELRESDEGVLRWIDDDQLTDLPLWEGDPIFLGWLKQDRLFSGKFIYKNKQFIDHSVIFY